MLLLYLVFNLNCDAIGATNVPTRQGYNAQCRGRNGRNGRKGSITIMIGKHRIVRLVARRVLDAGTRRRQRYSSPNYTGFFLIHCEECTGISLISEA